MAASGTSSPVKAKYAPFYLPLFLLAIFAYGSTLFNTFVIDDQYVLTHNFAVKSLKYFLSLFSRDYFSLFAEQSYRPVVSLSYMLDYAIWGMRAFGYHLHNLILHILNVFLVFAILTRIKMKINSHPPSLSFIAFITSGLFAVHTISGEAVNVISFREDLQVVFLTLFSLWSFIKILEGGNKYIYRCLLWLSCFLALLAKENAAVLPLLLICVGVIMRGKNFYRDHGATCMGAAAAFLFSFIIRFVIMTNKVEGIGPLSLQGNLIEKGIRIIKIQGIYIQSLFYLRPFLPNMAGVLSSGAMDRDFLLGIVSIMLFFLIIFFLRNRFAWAALGFYAVCMIPVSNIFMNLNNPVAYRYLYFPAIGLYFIMGILLINIVEKYKFSGKVLLLSLLLLLPQALYSNYWSRYWKDDADLWKYQVGYTPEYYLPWAELAAAQNNRGLYAEAEISAKKSISLKPDYFYSHAALGYSQLYQGLPGEALESFQKALEFPRVQSSEAEIFFGTGYAFEQMDRLSAAEEFYKKTLESNPRHLGALANLAILYIQKGRLEEGQTLLERAVEIDPADAGVRCNLTLLYLQKGEKEKARDHLSAAQKIDPQNPHVKNLLSRLQSKE
ncbi:tetratricopeptide repeat protein [Candidatus Sumerlaeota bacterium]|nr:tetratricopeptide repeat protein [Candidatus Sumerlaeota bacterium]